MVTTSHPAIFAQVREILSRHLHIQAPIELESDLRVDLHLDSIKQLGLVVELENHFRVCFEPGDEHGARTVGDVVALLARRLEEARRA